ncbi:MAG TPA: hypothetical protein VKQ32_20670 [Polyangia bacterium]|nr:hypothetical protein [Polyangia bacterium]
MIDRRYESFQGALRTQVRVAAQADAETRLVTFARGAEVGALDGRDGRTSQSTALVTHTHDASRSSTLISAESGRSLSIAVAPKLKAVAGEADGMSARLANVSLSLHPSFP